MLERFQNVLSTYPRGAIARPKPGPQAAKALAAPGVMALGRMVAGFGIRRPSWQFWHRLPYTIHVRKELRYAKSEQEDR